MRLSPNERARRYLRWLEKDDCIAFNGTVHFSQDAEERLAEVIADAQEEVREGFMRRPTRNEGKVHK